MCKKNHLTMKFWFQKLSLFFVLFHHWNQLFSSKFSMKTKKIPKDHSTSLFFGYFWQPVDKFNKANLDSGMRNIWVVRWYCSPQNLELISFHLLIYSFILVRTYCLESCEFDMTLTRTLTILLEVVFWRIFSPWGKQQFNPPK